MRLYKPNDEIEIIDILKKAFPDWASSKSPLEYWRWKYLDSTQKSNIFVATVDEKVVSVSHDLVLPIKIGGTVENGFYADDTATHPDFRGKNLHSKITDYKHLIRDKEGCKLSYSISTNPIIIESALRRGNNIFPFKKSHMVRIRDPSKMKVSDNINKIFLRQGVKLLNSVNKYINAFSSKKYEHLDMKINKINVFDDKINYFWDEIKDNYNYTVNKNKNYLNWRYCDIRGGVYTVFVAMKNDKIIGYVVVQVKEINDDIDGYIMDLTAIPNNPEVLNALLSYAVTYLENSGINITHYLMIDNSPIHKIARKNGFIDATFKSDMQILYNYRGNDENNKRFLSSTPSQISFSRGDYFQQI